ncbi:Uma2 family endonuclease [Argonema galeatum]|uniref:Uma2 family endonuclease n=1 Tax=Argonema galeatum TaxID=2942762 RepID=UPI002011A9E7|nr:Uma2 family endonuclease [Argonema galeatum]MCL1464912.1 Uma2 family endonuclease [Argonema galeatum A003/A1]
MFVAISQLGLVTNRALLSNVTWETLENLDVELAGTGARLTYLDGCLEIMSPLSEAHEEPKNTLGQLLEIYMRMKNIRFYGRGSTTIGMKELGARKEPDESYCLGTRKSSTICVYLPSSAVKKYIPSFHLC